MEKIKKYQNQFFFILLSISFILSFFILRPFLITLLVAIAFSVVLDPIYSRIKRLFGGWNGVSAFITIIGTLIVFTIPLSFLITRVITESTQAYTSLGTELAQPDHIIHRLEQPIQAFIPSFQIKLDAIVKPILQTLTDNVANIFSTTVSTVVNTCIFFIGLFFLLKDGNEIKRWLLEISPLPNAYDGIIIHRLEATVHSVIQGSLFISLIQGTMAGIGFAIFGVPNPTLLGLLTALASLIPAIGTPVITMPAAAFLYFTGHPIAGVGMMLWGLTAVGLIDNALGPLIIGRGKGVNIHPFLILISVLGGLAFFGLWGFLLGPLTISFLLSLLDVFGDYMILADDESIQKPAVTPRVKRLAIDKKK